MNVGACECSTLLSRCWYPPSPVFVVLAIVRECSSRLAGVHIGAAWINVIGTTIVYCGTLRMLNASVGTWDGCVKQSLWTSTLGLAARLFFKHRVVAQALLLPPHVSDYQPCSHVCYTNASDPLSPAENHQRARIVKHTSSHTATAPVRCEHAPRDRLWRHTRHSAMYANAAVTRPTTH